MGSRSLFLRLGLIFRAFNFGATSEPLPRWTIIIIIVIILVTVIIFAILAKTRRSIFSLMKVLRDMLHSLIPSGECGMAYVAFSWPAVDQSVLPVARKFIRFNHPNTMLPSK